MTESKKTFDESLLSGFLDGVLTQADEQRVRLHLDDSPAAREVLDELKSVRSLTLESEFTALPDSQWNERPTGPVSRAAFKLGWLIIVLWVGATAGFAALQLALGPESILVKVTVFAAVSGLGLLFVSVLIDRVRHLRADRYRGVDR